MTPQPLASHDLGAELETFVTHCLDGLSQQVRGNSEPFLEVWSHADDVAILGAVGSYAQGWEDVKAHLLGTSKRLDWTDLVTERLLAAASDTLALTVMLEYMTRGAEEEPAHRTLRTTHAYRRENGEWRLILRHANLVTPEDEDRERALATR
jgi:ketosteroid isomerase-like protein